MSRIARLGLVAAVAVVALVGFALMTGRGAPSPTPTLPRWPTSLTPPSDAAHGAPVRNGLLAPGTYTYGDVGGEGFNVRFTVPAGWTWSGRYLSRDGVAAPDGAAISFFGGPVHVYADPCHWARAQSILPTGLYAAHVLVTVLAAQPMRGAGTPAYRPADSQDEANSWVAWTVELTVPDDGDMADCDRGQFRSWGPDDNARVHQGAGQRDLVWAVDPGYATDGKDALGVRGHEA